MTWNAGLAELQSTAPVIGAILGVAVVIIVSAALAGVIVSGLSRDRDNDDE